MEIILLLLIFMLKLAVISFLVRFISIFFWKRIRKMGESILENNCSDGCNDRKNTVKCFFKDFFHCVIPLLFLYGFWLLWLLCLLKFSEYDFNFALDIWQVKVYRWFSGLFVFLFGMYSGLGNRENDNCFVFLFRVLALLIFSITLVLVQNQKILEAQFIYVIGCFFVLYK